MLAGLLEHTPKNKYKFVVSATIIQHDSSKDARGMHSALGSFWNTDDDGSWSWKMEADRGREFDAVISVIWIANDQQ